MWFLLSGLKDNVYMEGFLNFVNCDKVVIVELLVSYEDFNNILLVSDKIELVCIENLLIFI